MMMMCNNYLERGGGWEMRGGIGEMTSRGRGLDVKFNAYRGGGITFSVLFENWKSSGRVINFLTL